MALQRRNVWKENDLQQNLGRRQDVYIHRRENADEGAPSLSGNRKGRRFSLILKKEADIVKNSSKTLIPETRKRRLFGLIKRGGDVEKKVPRRGGPYPETQTFTSLAEGEQYVVRKKN